MKLHTVTRHYHVRYRDSRINFPTSFSACSKLQCLASYLAARRARHWRRQCKKTISLTFVREETTAR